MIDMENITKSFPSAGGPVPVLKGISLHIAQGEFVSIMGPSGSGKSTLSSILGCLAKPSTGSYKLSGHEVTRIAPKRLAALRNHKIGFIFQDYNLLDGLSIQDNVSLPLFYQGISRRERRRRAADCLKEVGLEKKIQSLPKHLSGGQKQRVAIARALVSEPAFLFADEPTGALDKKTGHEIMGLIQRLNLLGHTVVQVTHSQVDANFSKRILYLVDGLIVRDEMVEKPTLGSFSPRLLRDEAQKSELVTRLWKVAQFCPTEIQEHFDAVKFLYKEHSGGGASCAEAVKAIVRWQNAEGEALFQELFHHEDWTVRTEVIRAAIGRSKEYAIPFCIKALSDTNAWVRYLGVDQMKKTGHRPTNKEERDLILAKLEDEDERVRASTVALLNQWKDPALVEPLKKSLKDDDGRVRANAVEALALFFGPHPELVDAIKPLLEDKNNRCRGNAAFLLYKYAPRECVETLHAMLVSENNLMRATSAWALGMIPSDAGGELLLANLVMEKEELALNQTIRSLAKLSKDYFPLMVTIQRTLDTLERS